ncbi:hypothetical protein OC835_004775 [Tilletia horrida]|nr:hypothetical protein OC835_004775 [Tilletia horrida]KAK0559248.1 hypothetical protein OC844_004543 [Tilletia horrida]
MSLKRKASTTTLDPRQQKLRWPLADSRSYNASSSHKVPGPSNVLSSSNASGPTSSSGASSVSALGPSMHGPSSSFGAYNASGLSRAPGSSNAAAGSSASTLNAATTRDLYTPRDYSGSIMHHAFENQLAAAKYLEAPRLRRVLQIVYGDPVAVFEVITAVHLAAALRDGVETVKQALGEWLEIGQHKLNIEDQYPTLMAIAGACGLHILETAEALIPVLGMKKLHRAASGSQSIVMWFDATEDDGLGSLLELPYHSIKVTAYTMVEGQIKLSTRQHSLHDLRSACLTGSAHGVDFKFSGKVSKQAKNLLNNFVLRIQAAEAAGCILQMLQGASSEVD